MLAVDQSNAIYLKSTLFLHSMSSAKSWRRTLLWFSDVKIPLSFKPWKVQTPYGPRLKVKGPWNLVLKLKGPFMRLKGYFPQRSTPPSSGPWEYDVVGSPKFARLRQSSHEGARMFLVYRGTCLTTTRSKRGRTAQVFTTQEGTHRMPPT